MLLSVRGGSKLTSSIDATSVCRGDRLTPKSRIMEKQNGMSYYGEKVNKAVSILVQKSAQPVRHPQIRR